MFRPRVFRVLLVMLFASIALRPRKLEASSEPHWIRVDSDHFSVLTDSDEKKAHEVVARFEQMRAVFAQLMYKSRINMSEPIDIIAFRNEDEYEKYAPARQGSGLGSAFFISGEDCYYFVLNLSQDGSWRTISRNFAQALLNYNYPPTQPWFDDGFTQYFSSLQLNDKQMQIGGDPGLATSQSFASLLEKANWFSLTELFSAGPDRTTQPLLQAESWIVMHYLLNKEKLPAAGTYFSAVENEKLPVDQAIQKAFGMSSSQMQQAVQDYFHSILPALQPGEEAKAAQASFQNGTPAPVTADVIGTSSHEMLIGLAQSLVAEMSLRVPEHRDAAHNELESLIAQPKMDNVAAHRALAWDAMQQQRYDNAVDELGRALTIDNKDPMTHYYLALYKFQQARLSGQEMKGLANMMQDLHYVLDWDHEFAEAYYMLAIAQTEGGGLRAAADSIRTAIQLSPRRTDYVLELARIYEEGKNWDAATALLERLATNSNGEIATAANKDLHNLPYIKKYGLPPVDAASAGTRQNSLSTGSAAATAPIATEQRSAGSTPPQAAASPANEESNETSVQPPATPQIDRRPVRYVKGRLVSVDCSQAPVAIITVTAGGKIMRFRTPDYKSLMLVGEDTFSCDWVNRPASVNYKAGGKADGDLVSLEIH